MGTDLKHYLDYSVKKTDTEKMDKVSSVTINYIRINDIVELIYEHLDPRNNLRDPTIKIALCTCIQGLSLQRIKLLFGKIITSHSNELGILDAKKYQQMC